MLARENKAAMEQEAADALARANEEKWRRQEEMQRRQDEELEAQRRQLAEHQEHLRREAEVVRCANERVHAVLQQTPGNRDFLGHALLAANDE